MKIMLTNIFALYGKKNVEKFCSILKTLSQRVRCGIIQCRCFPVCDNFEINISTTHLCTNFEHHYRHKDKICCKAMPHVHGEEGSINATGS